MIFLFNDIIKIEVSYMNLKIQKNYYQVKINYYLKYDECQREKFYLIGNAESLSKAIMIAERSLLAQHPHALTLKIKAKDMILVPEIEITS